MKKYSLKKLFVTPAALGLVLSFGLFGPAASADENSDKQAAAQAAVDKFGGCTINVESDDYKGKPAWEVELKNTNVKNGANGRIEVKVAKSTYEILAKEDEDSDDGECNDAYPSADDNGDGDGNGDSSISKEDAGKTAVAKYGGTVASIAEVDNKGKAAWAVTLKGTDKGTVVVTVDKASGKILGVAPVNIYITPGEHTSGGREWRTTCEPYSATERCRTEIWSTEVEYRSGKLVKNTGWHFNNLTYKESKRALWEGNPLGKTGDYTINGRQWRTECETSTSGGNGCRSYIVADVVQATKKGNSYTYKMGRKEVFNNIVMFKIS